MTGETSDNEFEPPSDQNDKRVCGTCRRLWGSVLVPPMAGYFSILNTKTGKYHADGGYGDTSCGRVATGDEWLWPQ